MVKGKYAADVLAYARGVIDGSIVAGIDRILGCQRFLAMIDSGEYEIRTKDADFVIGIIEASFKHRQGEMLDATPLRGKPFLLEPWEKFCVYGMLIFYIKGTNERVVKEAFIFIPRKNGKALALDTPIPTPSGWTRMGDIAVGDYVFGRCGAPARVNYVSPVFTNHDCYDVEFEDGEHIVADAGHIWTVATKDSRRLAQREKRRSQRVAYDKDGFFEITTERLWASRLWRERMDGAGREYTYRVQMARPLDLQQADLPIDPYVLGVWLGDGSSSGSSVTVFDGDAEETMRHISEHGYSCHIVPHKDRAPSITIGDGVRGDCSAPSFKADLRRAGVLGHKHIPQAYLRGSIVQRMSLLCGLMDTDGTVSRAGQCVFCQKSPEMINGFRELLASLGIKNTMRKRSVVCNGKMCEAYEVAFFTDQSRPCFLMERKRARLKQRLAPRMSAKTIVSVIPVQSTQTRCISVDANDHLYLAGKSMTVTHNTIFVSALSWALGILERMSGSKVYVVGAALKQAMETFGNWEYNVSNVQYGGKKEAQADGWRILDNNMEHSVSCEDIGGGSLHLIALASNPDSQDSFNCNIVVADEMHAYKSPKQYNILKEATSAYTNRLVAGITTAGDDGTAFCAQRLAYCQKVLNGTVKDDAYFIFICRADQDEKGDVDFTNPIQHQKANPNYGVSIRPQEIMDSALQALNDPQQRKDFLSKRLNIFVASMGAYFDIAEFRASNKKAEVALGINPDWDLETKLRFLAKLPIKWFGGADLSKLHDLTSAALHGQHNGIDICIPHAWFPVVAAAIKADQDGIPLYGWRDDGWLDLCNAPTNNHADVVNWFISMRKRGFHIKRVGHDRRFCREYFLGMKKAGFSIVDQPQYFYKKSEGFRHIEKQAKNAALYYLGSAAYEYCVQNVSAIEKTDDMIQYSKIEDDRRIDIFDADVFASLRMLEELERSSNAGEWLDE